MTVKEKKFAEQKNRIMTALKCSEEEALQIMADDEIIDKGGRTYFDLPKEQEQEIYKQYVHAHFKTSKGTKKMSTPTENNPKSPTVYKFDKRKTRAENVTKSGIIAELFKFFNEKAEIGAENVEILNKERQIAFVVGENSYELTLVQKRKPKN